MMVETQRRVRVYESGELETFVVRRTSHMHYLVKKATKYQKTKACKLLICRLLVFFDADSSGAEGSRTLVQL